ncbi:hypothetical protein BCR34DRAFT_570415 [Clohesyomyces aquaticus]|uniref:BTB domain-containing protein n=1 Tax=Clohesyomyces aquaticus TaxID=1231657 RepID=A0A1Y1ZCB1_9PLEO|nr:hypothetical protein BCR34DRAFT_570415 [Clohesyomyces aquaticus]
MPSVVHEIDPLADTILILKNPCRNFAPWNDDIEPADTEIADQPEWKFDLIDLMKEKKAKREQGIAQTSEPAPKVDKEQQDLSGESAEPSSEPNEPEVDEIHYFVSSRHLMLASPWFKRTLTREGSMEAVKCSDGRYHISASDWDEEAFLILLNILHVRTRQVPATVNLEMLAKIAVIVNYYELEDSEAIERDIKAWIADLRNHSQIPSSYCRDLMLWICTSQVFSMRSEFEEATAVAIKTSQGRIQTLKLPIREKTESDIERVRCDAIDKIVSELYLLLEVYGNFDYLCRENSEISFQCGAFLFGAMMKHMKRLGYLSPRPKRPFVNVSLEGIWNWGEKEEDLEWGVPGKYRHGRHFYVAHECSLHSSVNSVVHGVMNNVKGLTLHNSEE